MKILLVDDEPALRELLRTTLESVEIAVDEAASAEEAETRIRRRRPDLIVLDLRMPGMSGSELCRRLKSDERTSGIPIVLLTGADEEEARSARRARRRQRLTARVGEVSARRGLIRRRA